MYLLSDGHKLRLRKQIITGARNYNKYLINKVFKIVCEDGTEINVRFFGSDFKHLTGLNSDLDNEKFYKNCVSGVIDIGNMRFNSVDCVEHGKIFGIVVCITGITPS